MSAQDSLPREYRSKAGRTAAVLGGMGVGSFAALSPLWTDEDIPGWVKLLVSGVVLAFFGWFLSGIRNCATTVDLKGIQVRTLGGTRRLAWEDIQEIRAVPNAAASRHAPKVISYAYDTSGKRVPLIFVDDIHVAVEREIDAIRAAWTELRGAGWEYRAEVWQRIGRQDAREARRLAVAGGIVGMCIVISLVVVVVLAAGD
ncbi:PH domain-containing protein [Streptomyces sp. NPDC091371]|uniref:PH domain-containing protein n=1 Tax=Streptomyces sp. NPDC091371 TaxID=3155303 RepID=UPI0034438596